MIAFGAVLAIDCKPWRTSLPYFTRALDLAPSFMDFTESRRTSYFSFTLVQRCFCCAGISLLALISLSRATASFFMPATFCGVSSTSTAACLTSALLAGASETFCSLALRTAGVSSAFTFGWVSIGVPSGFSFPSAIILFCSAAKSATGLSDTPCGSSTLWVAGASSAFTIGWVSIGVSSGFAFGCASIGVPSGFSFPSAIILFCSASKSATEPSEAPCGSSAVWAFWTCPASAFFNVWTWASISPIAFLAPEWPLIFLFDFILSIKDWRDSESVILPATDFRVFNSSSDKPLPAAFALSKMLDASSKLALFALISFSFFSAALTKSAAWSLPWTW